MTPREARPVPTPPAAPPGSMREAAERVSRAMEEPTLNSRGTT